MNYGSVCSGIEAASVAWAGLGWKPAWFSEIEKFPSAVLAQRWPEVTNLGDMTRIAALVSAGSVAAPDVMVGGTPCQAYSIAGHRKGLADERGKLTLSYMELANAIDNKRRQIGKKPAIFVWENVTGVLNSRDNAFGCFLGGLAGESCELQPAGGRWTNAGCVYGPERVIAWRVFDAQYFGLAQRRPRVFVVASGRTDFDPTKVLFECVRLRRIDRPTRETPVPVCLTARGAGSLDDRETYIVEDGSRIRHLTPLENERQMGFPDDHTRIEWRGELVAECPDGPRYKAIGNSMPVDVMRWLGEGIAAELAKNEAPATNWQRPFLKWAGGKFSLLTTLDSHIPAGLRLIEPFVGGGSVFMNSSKHSEFLLGDANSDLINLYQMLAVASREVIRHARFMFEHMNDAESYGAIRREFNSQRMAGPERAASFLYLNRHCFNGLCRYNLDNKFNVGWGAYRAPYFPEKEIQRFVEMAHNCVFMNAGFRRTLSFAGAGDVVYCDPPYEPMPGTSGFTSYSAGGFTWEDQVALAEHCVAAHQRGARIVISNSTAPLIVELYTQHGFRLHGVNGRRSISSNGSGREDAKDLVATL